MPGMSYDKDGNQLVVERATVETTSVVEGLASTVEESTWVSAG
ncbi:MAG TPA: hypothetical protein RMG48_11740 [Myxococcales bacterium LLY-WYZ-16_1]|nr:hypothetical protein [Myxococcales bacterium LLY-WYZ-16_1]